MAKKKTKKEYRRPHGISCTDAVWHRAKSHYWDRPESLSRVIEGLLIKDMDKGKKKVRK